MRFPTNLLSVLKDHNGVQLPEDGMLDVPGMVMPVAAIPEPSYSVFFGDQGGLLMRTSFLISESRTHTNAAALQASIGLSAGLWELDLSLYHVASYTDIPNTGGMNVAVVDLGAFQDFNIFDAKPITNFPTFQHKKLRLSLPRETATLVWTVNTNGAGETDYFCFSCVGNRLM